MPDFACADWLARNVLQGLIDSPPATFDWMILEAVDKLLFDPFQQAIDLDRFNEGRAFGSDCEVRWRRDGEVFHTLAVGGFAEAPSILSTHQQLLALEEFELIEHEYFLWGEWSNHIPEWVEATIPHIFNYPPPPQPGRWRRKLKTIEYVNRRTGEMEFYRFAGTREVQL